MTRTTHPADTAVPCTALPGTGGPRYVTDGGIETDLIYRRGVQLPDFAAFPLLDTDEGRAVEDVSQ